MYILKTKASFDSAHFLSGYEGKCANIHGHRWSVEVKICDEELESDGQNRGMIVDFSKLKEDIGALADSLDHAFIIERGSLRQKTLDALLEEGFKLIEVSFRPTAENFSKYFYDMMQEKGYRVHSVTVYETPNNCATYRL